MSKTTGQTGRDDDMSAKVAFSGSTWRNFAGPHATLKVPVYLDPEV
jgi:hypothetical protein